MNARALTIRYLNGEANDDEVAALEAWLLESPANATLLAECAMDEMNLPGVAKEVLDEVESRENDNAITPDLLAALLPKEPLEPVDITQQVLAKKSERLLAIEREQIRQQAMKQAAAGHKPHVLVIPRAAIWLATAAMIGLVVWLGMTLESGNSTVPTQIAEVEPVAPPQIVATIDASSDAVWAEPAVASVGLQLGVTAELLSGVAEIKFDKGAVVLVQGPATITPTSDNALQLGTGQLVAEVPPSAVGFEVDTRFGLVRDFGTEFGVSVDPAAGMKTQVYQGEIGVMARDGRNELGEMTRLLKNEAAAIHAGKAQVVIDEPVASRYLRRDEFTLITKANPSPAERWQAHLYKLKRESNLIAHLGFSNGQMQLKQGPAGESFEATWVAGKVIPIPGNHEGFQAMRLEGFPEQGIDLQVADHPGYDKLTLIAWARVEPQVNRTNAPLLHHGRKDMPKSTPNWQLRPDLDAIHVNQFAQAGTTHSAGRVSATLDGIVWEQWHCYAVVLDARTGQCEHYLDGRWVGSGELVQKVPLKLDGLRIASTGRAVTDHPRTIKGEIGLFTFLNTTLDAEGIRQLYDASRPLFD